MSLFQELKRPRDDITKKAYTGLLWILAALLISINLTLMKGCVKTKPVPSDITSTISCPIADDIKCQKCHGFKKSISIWYNPVTEKLDKAEIILPIGIEIDFKMCVDTTIVNSQGGKDWICRHTFKSFKEKYRAVQVLYNRWGLSGALPSPPLAIIQIITFKPYSDDSIGEASYWIYRNGVPIEVEQDEFDLYIMSLKGGVKA